jgi:CRISPR-associated endoribonuclease Cas6
MRVKIIIGDEDSTEEKKIKRDYRSTFISFFKSIFENAKMSKEIYSIHKKVVPFCSSVYLGENMRINENFISFKTPVFLFFSTAEFDVYSSFLNGCIGYLNDKNKIKLKNGQKLCVIKVEPIRHYEIKFEKVNIKTMSPFVVQNMNASRNDYNNLFLTPNSKDFQNVINIITQKKMKYLGVEGYSKITMTTNRMKIDQIPHYKGYIRATRGDFELQSSVETLKFLYDYGIGTRTGQLFGMFRII